MKIFRDITKIPKEYQNSVIILGNFDGFHLGHRSIITKAKTIANSKNLPLALMTFEPHPREFLAKEKSKESLQIYNLRSKLVSSKSLGIKCVFLIRFNKQFTSLSAHDFIQNILVNKLNVRHIITGENFCFGKNRQGNKELLAQEKTTHSFDYTAYPEIIDNTDNNTISSSNIRTLLKQGEVKKAATLLGRQYHICGRVKHGEKRGQKLGFPTANIPLTKLFLPKFGVYAVQVRINEKSKIYNAVANLGIKPTFGKNTPLLEVHLFDTNTNLYNKKLYVEFVEFLREEQKFLSLDELKNQIVSDCKNAKKSIEKYEAKI